MENKNILYDDVCERLVIGSILSNKNELERVRENLNENCFYKPIYKNIYKAIIAVSDKGDTPDPLTIQPYLAHLGENIELADLLDITSGSSGNIEEHVLRLSELSKRRQLETLGVFIQQQGLAECMDLAEVMSKINDSLNSIEGESTNHIRLASDYLNQVDERINNNIKGIMPKATYTGLGEIDRRGGFQPTNLIIVAADSSIGKTSFADTIVLNASRNGNSIAFYSLEMTGAQIMTRLLSMDSGVPCSALFNHALDQDEHKSYKDSAAIIKNLNIFFDDRSTSNIDTIKASIRSMVKKRHIDGAVIDYLQILSINAKSKNTEEQLAEITRSLKCLAVELNIWIVLLSQLSRDTQNPEPVLSRLRGSGQINEASDVTILLYRPEYYTNTYGKTYKYSGQYSHVSTIGTALVNVAKGRNTGPYSFICGFNATTTKFYDLESTPTMLPFGEVQTDEPF